MEKTLRASGKVSMAECLRQVFEESLGNALGVSAKEAIIFHLRNRLGGDPFQTLWEDPAAFYKELELMFHGGAKILIELFVDGINKKLNSKHRPETFLKFLTADDEGLLAEWHNLLENILANYA